MWELCISHIQQEVYTRLTRCNRVTLQNQQFGIAYTVNGSFETGVFGIGYPDFSAGTENASIPFSLAKAGHINTMAYSMWLNCRECTEANLLFGGIDTEKYQVTIPFPLATRPSH